MEFDLTEEQVAIRDSLDRWLAKNYAFDARRRALASERGMSDEAWATYADMGLLALPLPEEYGGLATMGRPSGVDVAIAMNAFGRALVLEPYVPTVILGGGLVALVGSEAQREALLPSIADGSTKLALAHQEPDGRYARHRTTTTAKRDAGGWRIDGAKAVVVGAPQADHLVVVARTSGAVADEHGLTLFLVAPDAPGLTMRRYRTHDGRRAADLVFDAVRVDDDAALGRIDHAAPALDVVLDRAVAAVCEENVGVMAAMNDQTLSYLKTRKQFGVTIGSFQALQHRMADLVVALEQARSMATLASVKAHVDDAVERARTVSAAKAYVGRQARLVGQEGVQMHGGMGLVDELVTSHYFRRITGIETEFGDTDHHLARFSALLLDDASLEPRRSDVAAGASTATVPEPVEM